MGEKEGEGGRWKERNGQARQTAKSDQKQTTTRRKAKPKAMESCRRRQEQAGGGQKEAGGKGLALGSLCGQIPPVACGGQQ